MKERIDVLRAAMKEQGVECSIVTKPENIYYFTNVFPHEPSFVIITGDEAKLVVAPSAYREAEEKARIEVIRGRLDIYGAAMEAAEQCKCLPKKSGVPIINFLRKARSKPIGVEGDYAGIGVLKSIGIEKHRDISPAIMAIRSVKDENEIKLMKKAVEIAEKAMRKTFEEIGRGKSEREISGYFDYAVKKLGADETKARVRFGKNSAKPFSRESDQIIEEGPILIDYGARVRGYWSDLTRMFHVGKPSQEFKRAYSAVIEAQDAAVETAKAGEEVSKVLRKYDYEKNFVYTAGHGIGLEIHEPPIVSSQPMRRIEAPEFSSASSEMKSLIDMILKMARQQEKSLFAENVIVTLEPGVYLEDFGVRLEDMVLIKKGGAEVLSHYPKDLESVVR